MQLPRSKNIEILSNFVAFIIDFFTENVEGSLVFLVGYSTHNLTFDLTFDILDTPWLLVGILLLVCLLNDLKGSIFEKDTDTEIFTFLLLLEHGVDTLAWQSTNLLTYFHLWPLVYGRVKRFTDFICFE